MFKVTVNGLNRLDLDIDEAAAYIQNRFKTN